MEMEGDRNPRDPESFRGSPQKTNGALHPDRSQIGSLIQPDARHEDTVDTRLLQAELIQQKSDIRRMDDRLDQLQKSINSITRKIEETLQKTLSTSPISSESETLDLLTETVSTLAPKVGEIDGLKLVVDSCRRRISRLESKQSVTNASPVPKTMSPTLATPGYNERSFSAQQQASDRQASEEKVSQRPLQHAVSDYGFNPPAGLNSDLSNPRKRGRPPKQTPTYLDGIDSPAPERAGSFSVNGSDKRETDAPIPMDIDQGRVVRRGSGVGFGEDVQAPQRRQRQKPTRLADGTLLRKNGLPDKRSSSSAQNLKKVAERKKQQQEVEASDGRQEKPLAPAPLEPGDSPTTRHHETVMKQMFPLGVHEEARRKDHAGNIFSSDREPKPATVQPRKDLHVNATEDPPAVPSTTSSFKPVNAPQGFGPLKA